jgi:two-component system chemotaxis response regulator CheY
MLLRNPTKRAQMIRTIVIDDSRAMRRILHEMLGDSGFSIVEAEDGLDAIEKLKNNEPFELALLDWNMPKMNGLEFLKAIRADRTYDHMLVLMVTTETEASQVSQALEFGANEYIMKPFTRVEIVQKLALMGFDTL